MKKVSCEWINSTFYLTLFLFLVTWTIEDYRPIVIQSNDSRQKTIGGSVLFSIINLHRAKTDLKRCFNLMAIFYDSHTIAYKEESNFTIIRKLSLAARIIVSAVEGSITKNRGLRTADYGLWSGCKPPPPEWIDFYRVAFLFKLLERLCPGYLY